MRFQPVPHFIPANAVEFAGDGARLTFSADCGPNDELCAFAAGTDLLLIEATLPVARRAATSRPSRPAPTARGPGRSAWS